MKEYDKDSQLVIDCLHEMYMCSEPPLNFLLFIEELKAGKIECSPNWFKEHEIEEEVYDRIKAKYMKKLKEKFKKRCLEWDLFSYGPRFKEE